MAIVKQTANKLTLSFFPWSFWIILAFLVIISSPSYLSILLPLIPKQLTCDRLETEKINCQFTTWILPRLSFTKVNTKVEELISSKYTKVSNSNNKTIRHLLILLTKRKRIIILSYPNLEPIRKTVETTDIEPQISRAESHINAFVNDTSQQSLNLQMGSTFGLYFFVLMIIIPICIIICSQGEFNICEFDRSSGYMIKKRTWLFVFTKTIKHPLLDIQDVQIEWSYHQHQGKRITLLLSSGKKLPLSTYNANFSRSETKIEAEANLIRKFLYLPKS
ncbi:MAG: hypothetical protein QNJ63_29405 [Calothrix sp. MO_192.B10]|nr:hypothetical protein [Calothrix sp. MO_192.B10]